mmetsp:Transcript_47173/g.118812  ORF Transcript_47173/g.118812 Transcript_47173/m.118812 type:complete len:387 (-) Transcript_47173:1279-2439(-)
MQTGQSYAPPQTLLVGSAAAACALLQPARSHSRAFSAAAPPAHATTPHPIALLQWHALLNRLATAEGSVPHDQIKNQMDGGHTPPPGGRGAEAPGRGWNHLASKESCRTHVCTHLTARTHSSARLRNNVIIDRGGHCHTQQRLALHLAGDRLNRIFVPTPCAARHPVVHIPEEHLLGPLLRLLGAVQHKPKPTVGGLAPPRAAPVVQRNPRGTPETIPYKVLHSHVGTEHGSIVDVAGFPPRTVGPADVVVVAAKHHRRGDFALCDGLVERLGQRDAALRVTIQDPGLAAHNEPVFFSLPDPKKVVFVLRLRLGGCTLHQLLDCLGSDSVGGPKILWLARGTHPAERSEPQGKNVAHDVLHVRGVLEVDAPLIHDVCPRALGLDEE